MDKIIKVHKTKNVGWTEISDWQRKPEKECPEWRGYIIMEVHIINLE